MGAEVSTGEQLAIHLDSFRSEPGETECYEACWSEGRSCKKCWVKCYRAGWSKKQVDADNKALVARLREWRSATEAPPTPAQSPPASPS